MASKRNTEPFAVAKRDSVREWLEEALAPLPAPSLRRMFGGAGLYSEETIARTHFFLNRPNRQA